MEPPRILFVFIIQFHVSECKEGKEERRKDLTLCFVKKKKEEKRDRENRVYHSFLNIYPNKEEGRKEGRRERERRRMIKKARIGGGGESEDYIMYNKKKRGVKLLLWSIHRTLSIHMKKNKVEYDSTYREITIHTKEGIRVKVEASLLPRDEEEEVTQYVDLKMWVQNRRYLSDSDMMRNLVTNFGIHLTKYGIYVKRMETVYMRCATMRIGIDVGVPSLYELARRCLFTQDVSEVLHKIPRGMVDILCHVSWKE